MTDLPVYVTWPLIFAVGIAGGFVNTIAGGASLLCMPVLAWLGLPANAANATNNAATTVQSFVAARAYARRGFANRPLLLALALPSVLGAVLGALFVVELPVETFSRVVGVLMLLTLAVVLRSPRVPTASAEAGATELLSAKGALGVALFGILGLYGGFFGGGIGLIMLPTLVALFGQDLLTANAVKSGLAFAMNATAFVVFAAGGLIHWAQAAVLTAGMVVGSRVGVRLAVERGAGWVRAVLVGVTVVAAAWFLTQ